MSGWIKRQFLRFRRLLRFGIVGVINTLVDYGVFTLCYEAFRLRSGLSQAAGFLCGTVCGYLLNSSFTFREGRGRTRAQFLQYLGVDLVLMSLSSFALERLTELGLNAYAAKICITVLVTMIHYFVFKYLVFKIKKEDDP